MPSERAIRLFGDPVLRSVADPVTDFDDSLAKLVDDMLETMEAHSGAGLAANQVGVLRRVLTWSVDGRQGHLVNPEWTAVSDETEFGQEGCLSIPEIYADVERIRVIDVRGVDRDGKPREFRAEGFLARVIQHEVDHLDGVLFPKRLATEARRTVMAEIRSADWSGAAHIDSAGRLARVGG